MVIVNFTGVRSLVTVVNICVGLTGWLTVVYLNGLFISELLQTLP